MTFEKLYEEFYFPIMRMAAKSAVYSNFIEKEDLMQEMFIHLWDSCENGTFDDKTDSFIYQSLWFHLQNYLRKKKTGSKTISLDTTVYERGTTLKEIILDSSPCFTEYVENRIIIQTIESSGLTKRENEVFRLFIEGYNLREIGSKLEISHVRVFKLQGNIRKKLKKNIQNT